MTLSALAVYGFVAFGIAILSSAAGGGGGFILTPLLIFLGLSPAQAVSVGKFGGLAVSLGTVTGMKGYKIENKQLFRKLVVISIFIGIASPFIIRSLNPDDYQYIIGWLLIILAGIMTWKKLGHTRKEVSHTQEKIGLIIVSMGFLLLSVFSSGLGVIVNMGLGVMGLNALDATIIKRTSQLVLNSLVAIGVVLSGLVVWQAVVIGVIANYSGARLGSALALKKGSAFVSYLMAGLALLSGVGLLLT